VSERILLEREHNCASAWIDLCDGQRRHQPCARREILEQLLGILVHPHRISVASPTTRTPRHTNPSKHLLALLERQPQIAFYVTPRHVRTT